MAAATVIGAVALLLAGCNTAGPIALAGGRGAYREIINTTDDEEILGMIVRRRYGETFGMLNVASVTASIRVRAAASSDFRAWGSASEVEGELVPLSGSVIYEENPTISYVPLAGEAFLRMMLRPLTLDHAYLISEAAYDQDEWVRIYIGRINGIRNPLPHRAPPSPAFDRLVVLLGSLTELGIAKLGRTTPADGGKPRFFYSFYGYEDHTHDVQAFLDLLGLEDFTVDGREILIPLVWSVGRRSRNEIDVEALSVFDMIQVAGDMTDLPPPHLEAGIVEPLAWEPREIERYIRIRSARRRPDGAAVAVRFRDWWFYIDEADIRSKRTFALLRLIIGIRLEDKSSRTPVVTISAGAVDKEEEAQTDATKQDRSD